MASILQEAVAVAAALALRQLAAQARERSEQRRAAGDQEEARDFAVAGHAYEQGAIRAEGGVAVLFPEGGSELALLPTGVAH